MSTVYEGQRFMIIYSESYPPKRVDDKRTKFEQEKDSDWNYIQVVRSMLSAGNSKITREYLAQLENHFKETYGMPVDEYYWKEHGDKTNQ